MMAKPLYAIKQLNHGSASKDENIWCGTVLMKPMCNDSPVPDMNRAYLKT
jgi:hypothetical protein